MKKNPKTSLKKIILLILSFILLFILIIFMFKDKIFEESGTTSEIHIDEVFDIELNVIP